MVYCWPVVYTSRLCWHGDISQQIFLSTGTGIQIEKEAMPIHKKGMLTMARVEVIKMTMTMTTMLTILATTMMMMMMMIVAKMNVMLVGEKPEKIGRLYVETLESDQTIQFNK